MLRFLSTFGAVSVIAANSLVSAQQDRPNDPLKPTPPNQQNPTPNAQPAQSNRPAERSRATDEGPGAEHRQLESLVGDWQITGQCFEKSLEKNREATDQKTTKIEPPKEPAEKPDKPKPSVSEPEAFTGTDHSEWILGGRFVRCEIKGTLGNKSMHGIAMTGYDTAKRRFVSTWQDDQCNSIKMDEGTFDPSARTFTFLGESTGPNGETVKCRRVIKVTNRDEHTMVMYLTKGSQAEERVSEMTFRRTNQAARVNAPKSP